MSKYYDEDERDYADYDLLHTATTNSTASGSSLTLDNLTKAVEQLQNTAPLPKDDFYERYYKLADQKVQFEVKIDKAEGADSTIISKWAREALLSTFAAHKPFICGWDTLPVTPGAFIRYTRQDIRKMRKLIRDKAGKERIKRIARNPSLCEQDPRKLRRIARRKAEEIQRATGQKTTYTVYKHGAHAD